MEDNGSGSGQKNYSRILGEMKETDPLQAETIED